MLQSKYLFVYNLFPEVAKVSKIKNLVFLVQWLDKFIIITIIIIIIIIIVIITYYYLLL